MPLICHEVQALTGFAQQPGSLCLLLLGSVAKDCVPSEERKCIRYSYRVSTLLRRGRVLRRGSILGRCSEAGAVASTCRHVFCHAFSDDLAHCPRQWSLFVCLRLVCRLGGLLSLALSLAEWFAVRG